MSDTEPAGPSAFKLLSYKELYPAATTVGTGKTIIKTGQWRLFRPVMDTERCIACWRCWKFCPDAAVHYLDQEEHFEIDYDYCKGCGICARECPVTAISMEKEEIS